MKYTKSNNTLAGNVLLQKSKEEELIMLKFLAKVAEKYARSTNTACLFISVFHQPKMPASLIKKDQAKMKYNET